MQLFERNLRISALDMRLFASRKFILTQELGRLARWLRILGFDTDYYDSGNIGALIIRALRDDRTIITRRKQIGSLKVIVVESDEVKEQMKELIGKINLKVDESLMFTRCIICNELIKAVSKEEVKDEVPAYARETQQIFYRCQKCERIYWRGSHWENVRRYIEEIALETEKKKVSG